MATTRCWCGRETIEVAEGPLSERGDTTLACPEHSGGWTEEYRPAED